MQTIIRNNNIERVYPFDYPGGGWSTLPAGAGQSRTFSNGYISIFGYSDQGLNLAYLFKYSIASVPLSDGTTAKALLLYFK